MSNSIRVLPPQRRQALGRRAFGSHPHTSLRQRLLELARLRELVRSAELRAKSQDPVR